MLYLIDYENTSRFGLSGYNLLKNDDKVILFYGGSETIPKDIINHMISVCEVDTVELIKKGKNGLDFYIGIFTGNYLGKNPNEKIAIISKDKGFLAVSDACKKYFNNTVILASDICNANALSKDNFNNSLIYNGNDSIKVSSIKNHQKNLLNNKLCTVAKIENKNLELVDIYQESKTPFCFYSNLVHKYGKAEGLRIYHQLKEAGFKKS